MLIVQSSNAEHSTEPARPVKVISYVCGRTGPSSSRSSVTAPAFRNAQASVITPRGVITGWVVTAS
jgi:hypothetical protein